MTMERWTSISSVDSNSSSWPGTMNTNNNNDSNNTNNSTRRNPQSALESFRSMIQALGSEKMARIRGIIAEHHHQIQVGATRKGTPPPGGMIFLPNSSSSATTDTTDEVSLTIMHLESALGPEDMAELRTSMISVRRQSIHLDVLISSDMTAEELERSVETVKQRQDEVLELIFVGIVDLIAAKLGIEVADTTASLPVGSREIADEVDRRASGVFTRDMGVQRDMLKVPEVDSTGKSPSISNGITGSGGLRQRHKPGQVNAKKSFGGYSLWPRSTEGKGKGLEDAAGSSKERATMVTEKKKKRRGCVGICSIM